MIGRIQNITLALRDLLDHLADFLADMVESSGSYCQHTVHKLTHHRKRTGGMFATKLLLMVDWLANVIAGITNLNGSIIKSTLNFCSGLLVAGIKIIVATLSLDRSLFRHALGDIFFPLAGGLLLNLGHVISLFQRILCCQRTDRELTSEEKQMLQVVFQQSLSLYNIRIVQGWSGIFGVGTSRAFTLGNLVFTNKMDFNHAPSILVHECVHVWQYHHNGCRYASEALFYQLLYRKYRSAYDWAAEPARGRKDWASFNPEAAAELIEDIWLAGSIDTKEKTQPVKTVFHDQLYALHSLRAKKSVRLSAKNQFRKAAFIPPKSRNYTLTR